MKGEFVYSAGVWFVGTCKVFSFPVTAVYKYILKRRIQVNQQELVCERMGIVNMNTDKVNLYVYISPTMNKSTHR
jgi:hypothetical protein